MRKVAMWSGLLLASAPALLGAPVAHADPEVQISLPVEAAGWSWRPTLLAGEPSQVPEGDLAVQFDGRPDAEPAKATYLRLALGAVPVSAQVTRLTLVLPLDPAVDQDGAAGPVVACPLTGPLVEGPGSDPAKQAPADCTRPVPGAFDAVADSFAFDLTALAQRWSAGLPNHGIVVRPDPAAAVPSVLPFQLALRGASAITGRLTALAPTSVVAAPEEPATVAPAPPSVFLSPTTGFASGPLLNAPAALPPAAAPLAPAEVRAEAPPAVAPPAVPVVRTLAPLRASQAGLAAGTCLGLLLLLLVGWSLGDLADPRAFVRAERRRRDRLSRGLLVRPAQPRQRRQGSRPLNSAASTVT